MFELEGSEGPFKASVQKLRRDDYMVWYGWPCLGAKKWETDVFHHQCWEVLPFCRFQRQRCSKIPCPKDPDFSSPLALKTDKGQHLPALVVYKNPSPKKTHKEKHVNKSFTGLSRDFLGGTLFMCFFAPIRNDPKKTHKQNCGTHPVPGQSRKFVYVYVFFLALTCAAAFWGRKLEKAVAVWNSLLAQFQGQKKVPLANHAFACGIFAIFVISIVSRGLSKALVLLVSKFVIFAVFVRNPFVLAGQFTKSTVSWTPKVFWQISTLLECNRCQGLSIFWQGKWLLENQPRLRERSWIFSYETATAFLSFFFWIWGFRPEVREKKSSAKGISEGMRLFACSWKLPAYSLASVLTIGLESLLLTIGVFWLTDDCLLTVCAKFIA